MARSSRPPVEPVEDPAALDATIQRVASLEQRAVVFAEFIAEDKAERSDRREFRDTVLRELHAIKMLGQKTELLCEHRDKVMGERLSSQGARLADVEDDIKMGNTATRASLQKQIDGTEAAKTYWGRTVVSWLASIGLSLITGAAALGGHALWSLLTHH